ncbi:MAG: hypothetical protein RMY36_021730 [Nostoc sp. SerVER01]|nr:hypothetical protein [Nostoc sp. SerVER01]MDZ8026572.1 hypothetical protein [Nostoc sp. DedQUE11]MDZ8073117.1 hypothetical protein [Nostoc sp. DedQUE01]MDZ8080499.1 hypothetical protein [Nostoc sp. DcaGUA01]
MTSEQPKPLIDFSEAKEPPRSINLDEAKEAAPLEPEEISGEIEEDPVRNAFNRQEKSTKDVGSAANVPSATSISLEL